MHTSSVSKFDDCRGFFDILEQEVQTGESTLRRGVLLYAVQTLAPLLPEDIHGFLHKFEVFCGKYRACLECGVSVGRENRDIPEVVSPND